MDAIMIALIVVLVLVVAVAAVVVAGTLRRAQLRARFGPEYERVVTSGENRQEAELRTRIEEHDQLDIHPLTDTQRDSYAQQWRRVQAEFVEQPDTALAYANRLVERLMRERGYPVDGFEHQAGLLSVDLPDAVAHYREAHAVFVRAEDGGVSTEDLRRALVSFRAVFDELLGHETAEPEKERETSR